MGCCARCCDPDDSQAAVTRQITLLGVSLGISFIFLLVAGTFLLRVAARGDISHIWRYTIAGLVYKNWYPMINLLFVVFTPVAVIMSETLGRSVMSLGYDEVKAAWANFGRYVWDDLTLIIRCSWVNVRICSCFFGLILASIFGLPLVLLHNSTLTIEPFGLWIASTVVTFVSSIAYWIMRAASRTY
jgi:hypothetical protein